MKASEIKQWFEQKIDELKKEKVIRDDSDNIFLLLHEDTVASIEPGVNVFELIGTLFDHRSLFFSYLYDSADLDELQQMINEFRVSSQWRNNIYTDGCNLDYEEKLRRDYVDAIARYVTNFFIDTWKKDCANYKFIAE